MGTRLLIRTLKILCRQNKLALDESEELGKQRIEKRRLQGGSRFNIRFADFPSESQLTPETVKKALSEYVEFPS
jgi:hypothetical protein